MSLSSPQTSPFDFNDLLLSSPQPDEAWPTAIHAKTVYDLRQLVRIQWLLLSDKDASYYFSVNIFCNPNVLNTKT